jgi:hypothetical protein
MKSTLNLALFNSVLLLLSIASLGCAQINIVPRDFYLVAKYGAAGAWFYHKSWTLTIPVDGNALQESCCNWDEKPLDEKPLSLSPMKSSSLLSENDLKEIVISIKKSDFFNITRDPYPNRVADSPIFILSVIMDGKSHEVRMQHHSFVKVVQHQAFVNKDKPYIERLLQVWDTVLKKVPSPNENRELKFRQK